MELSTQIWWLILWGWVVKEEIKGKKNQFQYQVLVNAYFKKQETVEVTIDVTQETSR